MDERELRELSPAVIGALLRRGVNFAAAEAAAAAATAAAREQEADPPPDEDGRLAWLTALAWRSFLDAAGEPGHGQPPQPTEPQHRDEVVRLFLMCAHPNLSPMSAAALTLRAVGGLTTRLIAAAYRVPDELVARRIERAKATLADVRLERSGSLESVLAVLFGVFHQGRSGGVDLAAEAIRLTRRLATITCDAEAEGLLALMLLHYSRRFACLSPDGTAVPLATQDRTLWDAELIDEGIAILQAALTRNRLGQYQAQASIAALHADAPSAGETDWDQVVLWYDELLALTGNADGELDRVTTIGVSIAPAAGLSVMATTHRRVRRRGAVAAYLHEKDDDLVGAARHYSETARTVASNAERDEYDRHAARVQQPQHAG